MDKLNQFDINTELWERTDEDSEYAYNEALTAQQLATDVTGSLGVWGINGK